MIIAKTLELTCLTEHNHEQVFSFSAEIQAFYASHADERSFDQQRAFAQEAIAEAQRFSQFVTLKHQYNLSASSPSLFAEISQLEFSNPNYQAQANGFYSTVIKAKIEDLNAALLVKPMPISFSLPDIQRQRCEDDVQDKIRNLELLRQHWDVITAFESSLLNLEARSIEIPEGLQSLAMEPFDQIKSRWAVLSECRAFLWERNACLHLGLKYLWATPETNEIRDKIRQLSIPSWSQNLEKIEKTEEVFRTIWTHRPLNYKEARLLDDLRPVLSNFHQTQNLAELITNLQTLLHKEHLVQPFSAQCIDAIKTCFNALLKLMTFGHQAHFFKTQQQVLQQTIQGWITTLNPPQPAPTLPH